MEELKELVSLMEDQLPDEGGFWQTVGRTFDQMDAVESIISEWIHQYPDWGLELWCVFGIALSPIIPSHAFNYDRLFTTHVRQLCRMVVQRENMDRPTLIETACALCKVGENTPVHHEPLWAVLGDRETMAAFEQEPGPYHADQTGWWWDELVKFCRSAYRAGQGKPRSELYASKVKYTERMWETISQTWHPDLFAPTSTPEPAMADTGQLSLPL